MESSELPSPNEPRSLDPFRRAVLRGLGILLPPLLTIVIFVWIGNTVAVYLLEPMESLAERGLVYLHFRNVLPRTTQPEEESEDPRGAIYLIDGDAYRRAGDGRYVLAVHYDMVAEALPEADMPTMAEEVYRAYVDRTYLQRRYVIPVFLCLFLLVLYLLGKFLAAGVGRFFWMQVERFINRLPLIRNVYSSVKQVTDFLFSEREIEYTRVVAVEYPRKGIWTLAMVTGESLLDISAAANEAVVSVLIPTSPMPFTGFTVTVRRSETVDLNITIDQAFQFIVSCGVVVPPHQVSKALAEREGGAGKLSLDPSSPAP